MIYSTRHYFSKHVNFSVRPTDTHICINFHRVVEIHLSLREVKKLVEFLNNAIAQFESLIENEPMD